MIGEIQILDIFAPIALVWAVMAGVLVVLLKALLQRSGLYRWVWYPGLFDLALFCCLWTGIGFTAQLLSTSFAVTK
jgi:hypothetical protein